MHFEILVEDISGKRALEILVPKIIGSENTFRIISYKGIGRLPKNLRGSSDPRKRMLLDQLPRILTGYGKSLKNNEAVFVVCDLDNNDLEEFLAELYRTLERCDPKPKTCFCIAVEEGEAWYLGDIPAIKKAYPNAKTAILNSYENDSICGTWELLADAVYKGGLSKLKSQGWNQIGKEKSFWANNIAPHMDVEENRSPSFCNFRQKLRKISEIEV